MTALTLPLRPPFAAPSLLGALAAHAVPGLETHDAAAGTHTRVVAAPHGPALVTVRLDGAADHVPVDVDGADPRDHDGIAAAIRRWLDLDAETDVIERALAADRRLAPLVAARPGLRVLRTTDGLEMAIRVVLGQHVSLATARTFAGRLVATYGGTPLSGGLRPFPAAAALAAADPGELQRAVGVTGARAVTIGALARAVAAGDLPLDPGPAVDPTRTRAALLALPGIGPWSADVLALRALGDPDAYPAGDLVLRRALGVRTAPQAVALAERWRPWRAYAVAHLWTAASYVTPEPSSV